MKTIEFECWRKPVSKKNKMKFNRRHGRAYKDKSVREFEDWLFEFSEKMKKHWEEDNLMAWPMDKTYHLKVEVTYGTKRQWDLQNIYDCLCDAMEGVFYENDSQITSLEGTKVYDKGTEHFKVTLTYK
jgi:Holliday junction resolvase RusA-like endonuclease